MMPGDDPWSALLKSVQRQGTFRYVHGIRHLVNRGPCSRLHSHRYLEVVYHPTGYGVTHDENGRGFDFVQGSAVLYAPGEMHDQFMSTPGEDLCVQVALPPGIFRGPKRRPAGSGVLVVPPVITETSRQDLRLLSCANPHTGVVGRRVFDLKATAIILELIDQARCDNRDARLPVGERHVRRAERFVAEKFGEIGFVEEIAANIGIGYDHLRHIFRERRGCSLVHHLNETRVAQARAFLAHSPLPLKQIASACGFRDEQYFSSVFRLHEGISPGQYRQALPCF